MLLLLILLLLLLLMLLLLILLLMLSVGDYHPDTFHTMNNLANNFRCQHKYGEAEELFIVCLDRMKTALGRLMILMVMGTYDDDDDSMMIDDDYAAVDDAVMQ